MVLVAAFVLAVPMASSGEETCSQRLRAGLRLYEEMRYQEAVQEMRAALEQETGCTEQELVLLHVHIAKIHLVLEDEEMALAEMKEALGIDPYLSLDPMTTSPKIMQVLNRAREAVKREQAQAQALEERELESKQEQKRKQEQDAASAVQVPAIEPVPAPQPEEESGERRSGRGRPAWIAAGVGGAGAIGAAVMLGMAFSENGQQEDAAAEGDWDARDDHWEKTRGYATASYVLGGVAAVSAGISVYLFLTSRERGERTARGSGPEVYILPLCSQELSGLAWEIRF